MNKVKSVLFDFALVFVGTFIAQVLVFGHDLFATPWSSWKEAIASAILAGLAVIAAAIHPAMSRYGVGSE
jgi:hypothetical protein